MYDVNQMANNEIGVNAITDSELLARVARHKKVYFNTSWAHYDTARPGSLHLAPPEGRRADLARDYAGMRDMFFGPYPAFDDLLAEIQEIQDRINANRVKIDPRPGHKPISDCSATNYYQKWFKLSIGVWGSTLSIRIYDPSQTAWLDSTSTWRQYAVDADTVINTAIAAGAAAHSGVLGNGVDATAFGIDDFAQG